MNTTSSITRHIPSITIIKQYQITLQKNLQNISSTTSISPEEITDICSIPFSWNMTSQLISETNILLDIKKLLRKLSVLNCRDLHSRTRRLYREWTTISSQEKIENRNYASMNLEDFMELDLPKPNFTDRIFLPTGNYNFENRIHVIKGNMKKKSTGAPVVYWMSRDQRLHDNWALLFAQQRATELNSPLCIIFGLTSSFPGANIRSYGFMLRGLKLLQLDCENYNIPFFLLKGSPEEVVPRFCNENGVGTLITDFSPLLISKQWKSHISTNTPDSLLFVEVDAHNICPVRKVSNKCEFAAKTIRSKIHGLVSEYLTEFPAVQVVDQALARSHRWTHEDIPVSDIAGDYLGNVVIWESIYDYIQNVDLNVPEVSWLESGEHAAMESLKEFLGIHLDGYSSSNRRTSRLDTYSERRNDPSISNGCSGLSPYLHFGQLSSQRICLELKRVKKLNTVNALFPPGERTTSVHSFCEELVVRKELSDNFCYYNENYMTLNGAHSWAQTTLREHWNDPREVIYTEEQLERAQTGDNLWNAAQLEMVNLGKMHGFMRMYWAKKILEWTPNPEDALRIAIYLNDKYSLDGRDPNGYVGCMWAIAGVHDRAWGPERQVFGKIRYMNYEGCKRKFDILKYITRHNPSEANKSMNSKKKTKK